jgi:hypothetical protein
LTVGEGSAVCRAWKPTSLDQEQTRGLAVFESNHGDYEDGYFHQRHQNDGRSVPALVAGHLLRGAAAHEAIPKMAELATNADLKAGLKSHVIDTQNQIERLNKVFAKLGQQPKGTTARRLMA